MTIPTVDMQDVSAGLLMGQPMLWDGGWQTNVQMTVNDHGKERTVDEMVAQRIGDYAASGEDQQAVS